MLGFRRTGDFPLASDLSARFVPWIIGTMVFLSAVALVLGNAIERWQLSHSVQLSVEVPASAAQSGGVERALAALRALPGVVLASRVEDDHIAALLAPWIGEGLDLSTLLPALIEVVVTTPGALDPQAAEHRLSQTVPGIRVDDGRRWLEPVRATAGALQAITGFVLALIGLASVATIIFMTHTGLVVRRGTIDVFYQVGARDSYVARQFEVQALRLALIGGILDLLLVGGCLVIVRSLAARMDAPLLPAIGFDALTWALLALLPLAAALVALVTARVTVLATLARMP